MTTETSEIIFAVSALTDPRDTAWPSDSRERAVRTIEIAVVEGRLRMRGHTNIHLVNDHLRTLAGRRLAPSIGPRFNGFQDGSQDRIERTLEEFA